MWNNTWIKSNYIIYSEQIYICTDDKAADFVSAMGKTAERGLDARIQTLATKDDIRDLYKTIYLSGLVQFIAIVASVLAIVKFMK